MRTGSFGAPRDAHAPSGNETWSAATGPYFRQSFFLLPRRGQPGTGIGVIKHPPGHQDQENVRCRTSSSPTRTAHALMAHGGRGVVVIVHPSSSYVPRQPSICRDEPAPYTGSTNLQVSTTARLIDILLNWAGQGNAHSFPNPGRNVVENSIRYVHTAKNKRCITAIFFRVCVCCVCSRTRSFACIFSFTFLPCTIHG
jgi:hypothetical protein